MNSILDLFQHNLGDLAAKPNSRLYTLSANHGHG